MFKTWEEKSELFPKFTHRHKRMTEWRILRQKLGFFNYILLFGFDLGNIYKCYIIINNFKKQFLKIES